MKKKNDSSGSNAKIAIIFFAFLVFVAVVSLFIKIIAVVRSSQFDGSTRFTLSISNGHNIEIMSLSPDSKSAVIFKLNNNIDSAQAGKLLEIPLDGFVISNSLDLNQKIESLFMNAIFNCNKYKTNLTIIDFARLAMLVRAIPENSIDVRSVGDMSGLDNNAVGSLVNDPFIEKDHQTIQIINGTKISGLGSRLARLITNMGGNVIIVATENSQKKSSVISYIDKKTYTVEKLQRILGYEAIQNKKDAISDITIIIGEDKINSNPF
jgi:hypothetical protein